MGATFCIRIIIEPNNATEARAAADQLDILADCLRKLFPRPITGIEVEPAAPPVPLH